MRINTYANEISAQQLIHPSLSFIYLKINVFKYSSLRFEIGNNSCIKVRLLTLSETSLFCASVLLLIIFASIFAMRNYCRLKCKPNSIHQNINQLIRHTSDQQTRAMHSIALTAFSHKSERIQKQKKMVAVFFFPFIFDDYDMLKSNCIHFCEYHSTDTAIIYSAPD